MTEDTDKPETAETPTAEAETTEEKATAKAGKRSAKALKEVAEQVQKEDRKAAGDTSPKDGTTTADRKGPTPKTRTRLERRGKKYRELAKLVDQTKVFSLNQACELAAKTNPAKFDATVEVHVNLSVDPRQADQNIRATVALPHGTGKSVRVAVFAPADQLEKATQAGADIAGEEDLLKLLDKEQLDFDVLIATPQMMPKLGKYARLLGPRGLMPNPKSGTVATNVGKAVAEAKAGRVEYRVDKQGIVHQGIGKVSFDADKLTENAKAFLASVSSVKPASIKGSYIKAVAISTSMGPSIKVDIAGL